VSEELAKLRATLAELHEELANVEPGNPEIRALLDSAVADIQQTINRRGDAANDSSIVDRLRAAARHYEESHPTLSGILGSIVDALSRMGI
jgi:hypothetical protein